MERHTRAGSVENKADSKRRIGLSGVFDEGLHSPPTSGVLGAWSDGNKNSMGKSESGTHGFPLVGWAVGHVPGFVFGAGFEGIQGIVWPYRSDWVPCCLTPAHGIPLLWVEVEQLGF
jgi:hypothetical protein